MSNTDGTPTQRNLIHGKSLDANARRLRENEYEQADGQGVDVIDPADVEGTLFSGTVKRNWYLELIARHFQSVGDVYSVISDDGLTFSTPEANPVLSLTAHLGPHDFTDGFELATEGRVRIDTGDFADVVTFPHGDPQVQFLANDDLTFRLEGEGRFAGVPALTTTPQRRLSSIPSMALPVSMDLNARYGFNEIVDEHPLSLLRDSTPITSKSDRPALIITASAPTVEPADSSTPPTASGRYHRWRGVISIESTVEEIDPVILRAGESDRESRLLAFQHAKVADNERPDDPTFMRSDVAEAHAENEVIAQAAYSVEYLKDLFGSVRATQLDSPYTLAFGSGRPLKIKRRFPSGGYIRAYQAPRARIP